jgi:hypothetical protein
MIVYIFTLDYEIYGNGSGSLRKHVFEPAEELMVIFKKWDARFVTFVEVAELEVIEKTNTDPGIEAVKRQIKELHVQKFEIGLHIHPQWYRARHEQGRWRLDYNEYNLCGLPEERIEEILTGALGYLRQILGKRDFMPLSFRAGNWLLQPSGVIAKALAMKGIKIDSSVFKGGLQRQYGLDYRRAAKNGYFWRFTYDVNIPDPSGLLLELPIYTRQAPTWKLLTDKRINLQRKGHAAGGAGSPMSRFSRMRDFLRFWFPLKFDFCRMSFQELKKFAEALEEEDRKTPEVFKPIVLIGHTKDLIEFEVVDELLEYLRDGDSRISTFEEIYGKHLGAI